jgi:hypothetical protein
MLAAKASTALSVSRSVIAPLRSASLPRVRDLPREGASSSCVLIVRWPPIAKPGLHVVALPFRDGFGIVETGDAGVKRIRS